MSIQFQRTLKIIITILFGYIALFLFDYYTSDEQTWTLCLFKNITGYPCPGCGMSRATLSIFKGNFSEAFRYNILSIPFTLSLLSIVVWLILDLIQQKETCFKFINRPRSFLYIVPFVLLTLLSWTINIFRGI